MKFTFLIATGGRSKFQFTRFPKIVNSFEKKKLACISVLHAIKGKKFGKFNPSDDIPGLKHAEKRDIFYDWISLKAVKASRKTINSIAHD